MSEKDKQKQFINHCKIRQSFGLGEDILHTIFCHRWQTYLKSKLSIIKNWNGDEGDMIELLRLCSTASSEVKELLQTGKLQFWNIEASYFAIQVVSTQIREWILDEKDLDSSVNEVLKLQKKFPNCKEYFSDDEYENFRISFHKLIEDINLSYSLLDKYKHNVWEIGRRGRNVQKNDGEFKKFNKKAKALFKVGNIQGAIEMYNQKLANPEFTEPAKIAFILSNRSAALLLKSTTNESLWNDARKDAKMAIEVWPSWGRGYHRMARAEMKFQNWGKAQEFLWKALKLSRKRRAIGAVWNDFEAIKGGNEQVDAAMKDEDLDSWTSDIESIGDEIENNNGTDFFDVVECLKKLNMKTRYKEMAKKDHPLNYEQYGESVKEAAAANGSITAKNHLEVWKFLLFAGGAFQNREYEECAKALSKAIRIDHQLFEIPNVMIPVIAEQFEVNPGEVDTAICKIKSIINNSKTEMPPIASKYYSKFPAEEFLCEMHAFAAQRTGNIDFAIAEWRHFLERHPDSTAAKLNYAFTLCIKIPQTEELIRALDDFISAAPIDHRQIPACHYRKSQIFLGQRNFPKFVECFEDGLASERNQLACFLPYMFLGKKLLLPVYIHEKQKFGSIETGITTVRSKLEQMHIDAKENIETGLSPLYSNLKKKEELKRRKCIIQNFRQYFITNNGNSYQNDATFSPPKYDSSESWPNSLQKITVKDMSQSNATVFEGCSIRGRIIEWPILGMNHILILMDDENGDIQRIKISNFPFKHKNHEWIEAMKILHPNTMISICHPKMAVSDWEPPFIDVENISNIRTDYSLVGKCCYVCGAQTKSMKCAGCKMAQYCSKECQKVDWIELDHKDLCQHLAKYYDFM